MEFREVGKNPRGAFEDRANFIFGASRRIVLLSQAVSRTASNTVASKLSIPVLVEATRSFIQNLLTRRTVLVQRHWS
ncbi:MAG: hypothetical protein DMG48_12440 [Acidobacteria bacterium]|nr:MAG: hypothetical protein DMG48_12440 [Acidobacteriota bacterium]